MDITKQIQFNATDTIEGLTINYSCIYPETTGPETVTVVISYSGVGNSINVNRLYKPDGTFTAGQGMPYPVQVEPGVIINPFKESIDAAILTSVQNIFANYETL